MIASGGLIIAASLHLSQIAILVEDESQEYFEEGDSINGVFDFAQRQDSITITGTRVTAVTHRFGFLATIAAIQHHPNEIIRHADNNLITIVKGEKRLGAGLELFLQGFQVSNGFFDRFAENVILNLGVRDTEIMPEQLVLDETQSISATTVVEHVGETGVCFPAYPEGFLIFGLVFVVEAGDFSVENLIIFFTLFPVRFRGGVGQAIPIDERTIIPLYQITENP